MNNKLTLEWNLDVGRKKEDTQVPTPAGKLPRVARLMALAIKFDGMLREGTVTDYADLARLGLVTRARMTRIMNLLNLAPDIQEAILFLPERAQGRETIAERNLRPLAESSHGTGSGSCGGTPSRSPAEQSRLEIRIEQSLSPRR